MAKNECNKDIVVEHTKILACIPQIQKDLSLIRKKLIDGNGSPGLLTKHEILETQYDNHINDHDDYSKNRKWFIGLAISVFISLATTCITLYYSMNNNTVDTRVEQLQKIILHKQDYELYQRK